MGVFTKDYRSCGFGKGAMLLYGGLVNGLSSVYKKATIEDVNQYVAIMAGEGRQLDDIIDPNLRTQMHPQSLSIFSTTAYDCLKEQLNDERELDMFKIKERLEEAFDIQLEHENTVSVINIYMKLNKQC
ncbi:hypothetical protein L1987_54118 [Smallanthus sonchifolius]|uniref:Uncharacterized protein n=1 Tax=Smallanthus sonchifolius TaxID=185202 RepID=A0ACB9E6D1_9ASTR|nr:hypothetical protein L1987_54118 [Smallanthus sonchifolius]